MSKEALYFKKLQNGVKCELCPHRCNIKEEETGICGVRRCVKNENGYNLISENYGKVTAMMLDPIEKKPLSEFYPKSSILSIGSYGCNFKCSYCQNYHISQLTPDDYTKINANKMVALAEKLDHNIGIAFTYNEPTVYYEYVLDVAKRIKEKDKDLKIVLVSNGFINEEPLKELLPYVDAMNIDMKGGEAYYKSLCFGTVEPVLETIRLARKESVHVEVTVMLLEGENTEEVVINDIIGWIQNIDKDIPVHLTRYYPNYKMNQSPTSLDVIKRVYNQVKSKLNNVYVGNLTDREREYILEQN